MHDIHYGPKSYELKLLGKLVVQHRKIDRLTTFKKNLIYAILMFFFMEYEFDSNEDKRLYFDMDFYH